MDFRYLIVIFYIATDMCIISSSGTLRVRRGFGGGGHAGLSNLGGYAPGYGSGPAGQAAGYAALQEIRNNQNVAFWAANIAVASAVANDYRNQQSTTSQFVHQFIVPVTKSQNHGGGKGGHNRGGHSGGSNPGRGHGGGFRPSGHGGMRGRGQWKPLYGQTQNRHHGTGRRGNEVHERNSKNDFNGHENPHGHEIQHDPEHLQYLEHRHHHEHHHDHDHGHRREPGFHHGPEHHPEHDRVFQHHPEHRHEVEECHRHK